MMELTSQLKDLHNLPKKHNNNNLQRNNIKTSSNLNNNSRKNHLVLLEITKNQSKALSQLRFSRLTCKDLRLTLVQARMLKVRLTNLCKNSLSSLS